MTPHVIGKLTEAADALDIALPGNNTDIVDLAIDGSGDYDAVLDAARDLLTELHTALPTVADNTVVIELPRNLFDTYEQLRSEAADLELLSRYSQHSKLMEHVDDTAHEIAQAAIDAAHT